LFSQELSTVEIARRVVALATNVDYGLYLRGALEPDVEEEFLEALEVFVEQESFMISRLTTTGPAAVLEMQAKIERYIAGLAAIAAETATARETKFVQLVQDVVDPEDLARIGALLPTISALVALLESDYDDFIHPA
jgi:hypothetical protein